MNYHGTLMLNFIRRASYGFLAAKPRDKEGRLITNLKNALVDGDKNISGQQEVKEWAALADYLKSFPDTDGKGIPDVPDHYRKPDGRFSAVPSWNPIKLISGGNYITYGFLGLAIVLLVAVVLGIRLLVRKWKTSRTA